MVVCDVAGLSATTRGVYATVLRRFATAIRSGATVDRHNAASEEEDFVPYDDGARAEAVDATSQRSIGAPM